MFKCIIIGEGECDGRVYQFATKAELEAFRKGVSIGSDMYGAGSCYVADREFLTDPESSCSEVIEKYIRKYLPE